MVHVVYPGTFDPPTLGHFDIIKRASKIFDFVTIAIGKNSQKPNPYFTVAERIALLKKLTHKLENVNIVAFDGLIVDFVIENKSTAILRCCRNFSDFEYEEVQAQMNQQLASVETIYMAADASLRWISSTLIKEVASSGKRLHPFIPEAIEPQVFERLTGLF